MHSLIIGTTESGKTTLAKSLARQYRAKGIKIIVLDPLRDPEWPADYMARTLEDFLRVAKASRRCALFVDESGRALGKYNVEAEWTTTMARHWGHASHIIAQRAEQVAPTVRGQCGQAFIFRVSSDDAKSMANEYADATLRGACSLAQFHFYHATRFGAPVVRRIDRRTGKIYDAKNVTGQ